MKIARLAVETKIFPLYEIEKGREYTLTVKPQGVPVREYLKLQGRFGHLSVEEIQTIQANVEEEWEILMSKIHSKRKFGTGTALKGNSKIRAPKSK